LNIADIDAAQQADASLLAFADDDDYELQEFNGQALICCCSANNQWHIVLPDALVQPTLAWYHSVLGHCGISHLSSALRTHLTLQVFRTWLWSYPTSK